jgi:hypothetical protein
MNKSYSKEEMNKIQLSIKKVDKIVKFGENSHYLLEND